MALFALLVICAMLIILHPVMAAVLQISFSRYALTPNEVSQLYFSRGLCIGEYRVACCSHYAIVVTFVESGPTSMYEKQ